jgi:hypothetical protein
MKLHDVYPVLEEVCHADEQYFAFQGVVQRLCNHYSRLVCRFVKLDESLIEISKLFKPYTVADDLADVDITSTNLLATFFFCDDESDLPEYALVAVAPVQFRKLYNGHLILDIKNPIVDADADREVPEASNAWAYATAVLIASLAFQNYNLYVDSVTIESSLDSSNVNYDANFVTEVIARTASINSKELVVNPDLINRVAVRLLDKNTLRDTLTPYSPTLPVSIINRYISLFGISIGTGFICTDSTTNELLACIMLAKNSTDVHFAVEEISGVNSNAEFYKKFSLADLFSLVLYSAFGDKSTTITWPLYLYGSPSMNEAIKEIPIKCGFKDDSTIIQVQFGEVPTDLEISEDILPF